MAKLEAAGIATEVIPMAEAARGLSRDRVRPSRLPKATVLHTAGYTSAVARRLRRLGPDLVHTNSLKSGLYGCAAGRLVGVPKVWHIREQITSDHLPPAALRLVRASVRRLPTAVLANSRSTLGCVATPGLMAAVIPSPVEVISMAGPRSTGAPLRVGMVGRLAPLKGQHVFLEAFPEGTARATIVGAALFGESRDYEEQLRSQVVRLGLQGRVEMIGFREDIGAELGRLDVLVQASVIAEGFGLVVVEGMASSLAVVAPEPAGRARS